MKYKLEELKIEVTYGCPLSCVHCSSNASAKNPLSLDPQKCLEIITQAHEMGVQEISFSGGEPLIWKGLEDCIYLCAELGIRSVIYTSGNCDSAEQIFSALAKAGLYKAIFSLYSEDEREHNRITRNRDSFRNTLKAIELCNLHKIIPEIHFVALASNCQHLEAVVTLSKSIGIKTVSVLRFVPQGRGVLIKDKDTLNKQQNLELINKIKQIKNTGFQIRTGSPFNVLMINESPQCLAAINRLIIAPDLKIYPCDAFKQIEAREIVPNPKNCSLEYANLKECWETSSYLQTIRASLEHKGTEPCSQCGFYKKCLGGCLAQKFIMSGSLNDGKDPACLKEAK